MTPADLDAALLDMTDSQIMALLARRTAAREQRKREQNAARVRNWRNANGNANETQDVTQKNEHVPSECNASGNAPVTQTVMQKAETTPSPPYTHTREAKPKAPKPESVPIPEPLVSVERFPATWHKFIESRRLKGDPMTHLAAEQRLKTFAERPKDAVAGLEMAIDNQWSGFNWKWFDNLGTPLNAAQKPLNGHSGHPTTVNIRDGLDEHDFLDWYYMTFPKAHEGQRLITATHANVKRYREERGK